MRTFWIGIAAGIALLAALDLAFPPPVGRAVSIVVADRHGRTLRAFPVDEGTWRLKADLARTDPAYIRALLAMEDRRFASHRGVDPRAVARALWSMAVHGRVVSGASTITMQTAKLLEPRPRTIPSKAIEMARALQLERRYSKREILELYLTLAPYGGNLEGVRAASWAYFGREPERLSPEEIALLIALPQSPEARRPDRNRETAVAARARVLDRMADAGLLARDRAEEAKNSAAPDRRAFPADAWHAADEARGRATGSDVRTTLDAGLQAELEALARRRAEEAGDGVQVSILVVDVATRAVRAAVGSAGRDRPGGWLDLTDRDRSPGSTLKPFIYGLAFDDGAATPATRIDDLPKRFASYQPENFDRAFRGEVTVAEALQHSLNVPAVQALEAVGAERFAAALDFSGTAPVRPRAADETAGLAFALGGLGLTARDLAVLYAALGDEGRVKPLRWLEDEPLAETATFQLLTPNSAAAVRRILAAAPAPAGRAPAQLTRTAPVVAFKTGTSYGFRDAWSAGVSDDFAVVVWIGRADGAPRPGVTGREGALPLLFEVYDRAQALIDRDGGMRARIDAARPRAPGALKAFGSGETAPTILFPPDGAAILAEGFGSGARALVLAGRGEGALSWYVDGAPVDRDALGAPLWRPDGPGFYQIEAVDDRGRSSAVRARVLAPRLPAG